MAAGQHHDCMFVTSLAQARCKLGLPAIWIEDFRRCGGSQATRVIDAAAHNDDSAVGQKRSASSGPSDPQPPKLTDGAVLRIEDFHLVDSALAIIATGQQHPAIAKHGDCNISSRAGKGRTERRTTGDGIEEFGRACNGCTRPAASDEHSTIWEDCCCRARSWIEQNTSTSELTRSRVKNVNSAAVWTCFATLSHATSNQENAAVVESNCRMRRTSHRHYDRPGCNLAGINGNASPLSIQRRSLTATG
jgi:hypothetical protein